MGQTRSDRDVVCTQALEAVLNYRFRDASLLLWALTHRSFSAELASGAPVPDNPRNDNEQPEFLGDAVLGMVVAELLVARFPDSREGELTRLRASLVSRRHLATVSARLGLGDHLRLGRGEDRTGGRRKPALLANSLEAVLGALYLDSRDHVGLAAVREVIAREIVDPAAPSLARAVAGRSVLGDAVGDHKSALQERLQAIGEQPRYILADESGPDHQKLFRVEVHTGVGSESRLLSSAQAASKKQAQQLAAQRALEVFAARERAPGDGELTGAEVQDVA